MRTRILDELLDTEKLLSLRVAVLYDNPLSRHRGSRRILRIVTKLSDRHEVVFQPIQPASTSPDEEKELPNVRFLPPLIGPDANVPVAQRWSLNLFSSAEVRPMVDRLVAQVKKCDVLWCCSWWPLGGHLKMLGEELGAKVVADGDVLSMAHLSKARVTWKVDGLRAAKEAAWALRYLNWEVRSLRTASCAVVPSRREVGFVAGYTGRPVVAVRNLASDLVYLSGVRLAAESPPNVLFMGDMRFETNRMGAAFLAREVWPRLDAGLVAKLQPKLVLGGWAADSLIGDVVREDDPDIVVMANVSEVGELFNQCRVVAVPIFFGGGSPHKMMEAAASGRPVICSRYAASTMEAIDESGFFVTDSASEVATHIGALLCDPNLASRSQRQGSDWVQKHYSLDAWNRDMNDVGRALGIQEPLVGQ